MGTIRKYWFMTFLGAVLAAYIVTLVEPAWSREISTAVGIAFIVVAAWYLVSQLDRIEGKLDAILKKLDKG